jgi:hypothetical protein
VQKLGTGQGIVQGADGRIDCGVRCSAATDYEEAVFLLATPAPGSVFTGWMGPCELPDAGNRCDIRLNYGPVTFFAVFDRIGDPPTPLVEPVGPGAPTPVRPPEGTPPSNDSNRRGCTIFGTWGDDTIVGTSEPDVICALGGNDHVHGGGGNDVIYGDAGADEIEGHAGHDRLYGGAGADKLYGMSGNDRLTGGRGRDVLRGGAGQDELRARDGHADMLAGGSGIDSARHDMMDCLVAVERRGS